MKSRKEHIQDFLSMLAGASFTSVIIIGLADMEFSVARFSLYVIGGCLVGYGFREVALCRPETA